MNKFAFAVLEAGWGEFVVQNIANPPKAVYIFNYPIAPSGGTRNLMEIEGISVEEIKSSLLRGEINVKLRAKEIEILNSDIDVLMFNNTVKTQYQNWNVSEGTAIGVSQIAQDLDDYISAGGSGGITASEHEVLRQLVHFIDEGPGDGFASGAYKTITPSGAAFPTAITWWFDSSQSQKIVEKLITYNTNSMATQIIWNMYQNDGITIVHTVTDTITYVNTSFESTRTRSIV